MIPAFNFEVDMGQDRLKRKQSYLNEEAQEAYYGHYTIDNHEKALICFKNIINLKLFISRQDRECIRHFISTQGFVSKGS